MPAVQLVTRVPRENVDVYVPEVLVAARRTRLGWRQQLTALMSLTTLAVIVVVILVLAH